VTVAPVLAADDTATGYPRFAISPGIYPGYPPCMAWQETHGGMCGEMLYFDCEGRFGPPAPCDDPDFWMYWS